MIINIMYAVCIDSKLKWTRNVKRVCFKIFAAYILWRTRHFVHFKAAHKTTALSIISIELALVLASKGLYWYFKI